jgi:hypothetical protein
MDGSSSMERRKKENNKTILLGFIKCKNLRKNILKEGTMA